MPKRAERAEPLLKTGRQLAATVTMQGPFAVVVPVPAVGETRDGKKILAEHVRVMAALHALHLGAVRWHDAYLEVRTDRPLQALDLCARLPGVAYAGIGWAVRTRLPLITEASLRVARRALGEAGSFSVNVVSVGNPPLVARDVEMAVAARVLAGLSERHVRIGRTRGGTVLNIIIADTEALVFDWLVRGMDGHPLAAGELGVFVVDPHPSSLVAAWLGLRLGITPVFLTQAPAGEAPRLSGALTDAIAKLRSYVPLERVDLFILPETPRGERGPGDLLLRVLVAEELALHLRAPWVVGALASSGAGAPLYRQVGAALSKSVQLLEPTLALTDQEVADLAQRILGKPVRTPRLAPSPPLRLERGAVSRYRTKARELAARASPQPVPALTQVTRREMK